jgi:hypothetical protein
VHPNSPGGSPLASRLPEFARPARKDRHEPHSHSALRHHAPRRHAGRGDVAVRRGEAAPRPQARRAGHRPDRGRVPVGEPQGAGALRADGRRDVRGTPTSRPSE